MSVPAPDSAVLGDLPADVPGFHHGWRPSGPGGEDGHRRHVQHDNRHVDHGSTR